MKKSNKICCVFNYAPHYRAPIFTLMDKQLGCDFYFGDKVESPIKEMNVNELKGYKKKVKNIKILRNRFRWQKGVVALAFKPYKFYILTGDFNVLSSWLLSIFALILNKKVIFWMHGLRSRKELKLSEKFLIYNFYNLASIYFLYGDYSRNLMLQKGFRKKRMLCVYNSLDYDKQLEVRKKLGESNVYLDHFNNEQPVIIYLGRIQKVKKISQLIEAVSLLSQKGINCNVVVIGEITDDHVILEQIQRFDLHLNIWLYGACFEEEVLGELIYNADVCVSPGNVGLTALHCFTYGTPVITHNNFENQMPEFEIIEPGINGDFFIEDNIADLSEKIACWISLPDQQRREVRQSAYNAIDTKYNPYYQIKVMKEVFE